MNCLRGRKSAAPRRRINPLCSHLSNAQFSDSGTPRSSRAGDTSRNVDQSLLRLLENMRLDTSNGNNLTPIIGAKRPRDESPQLEPPDSNEAYHHFNGRSHARDGSLDSLERALEKTRIGKTCSFVSHRNDLKRSRIGEPSKNRSRKGEDDQEVDRITGQSHPPTSVPRKISEPSPTFTMRFPCMFCKEAFALRQSLHRHCQKRHLRLYTRKHSRPI